ncbi:hypothetical protein RND81_04G204300 [Saponaria officinalis]|uniref:Hexosyltransferase n=1 Tax=Saponaria officinalis TaxID=3572 RepID=A0AAW1LN39_SAPOF
MLPKYFSIAISLSLKPRFILFTLFSLLITFKILVLTNNFIIIPQPIKIISIHKQSLPFSPVSIPVKPPKWLEVIQGYEPAYKRVLRVGLVNFQANQQSSLSLSGIAEPVIINLEPVSSNITWNKLFLHEMSDKPSKSCPEIPMPKAMKYPKLDVVVVELPCGESKDGYNRSEMGGIRDVGRLQLSMASAHLIVENAIRKKIKHVYGVFMTKCEPMVELFRCDDLIWHEGDYWIYKPKVERLREFLSMPLGTCNLALPYAQPLGKNNLQAKSMSKQETKQMLRPREAYVTILHSSESYVCGAIALAQSILLTNTTKDLVLLADRTISDHSIVGLQAAGWKIKRVDRIRSPYANLSAYNAWNYSKLRVWQLTEYHKIVFIDSDLIVLRNIDHFFDYPQLSAAPNHGFLFNSGIMLVEPSECFFRTLMGKRFTIKSYNGGDQGYLNEVVTYWHRLSRKLNYMKIFFDDLEAGKRVVPNDQYAIHFFGLKPWLCYRDYDCNWDSKNYHMYASDDIHALWWQVHDAMPKELQMHCGMTKKRDKQLRKWRVLAKNENRSDVHWKIEIRDPRQYSLVGSTR